MALDVRRQDNRIRSHDGPVSSGHDLTQVSTVQARIFSASLGRSAEAARKSKEFQHGQIDRLRKPKFTNPGLFDLSRSQEILHYVIENLLPGLDIEDEIAAITAMMLNEEIDSRRELQDRLNQAQNT